MTTKSVERFQQPRWWERPPQWALTFGEFSRPLLSFSINSAGVGLVAVLSLLLEKVLVGSDADTASVIVQSTLILVLAALAWILMLARAELGRRRGTRYYVRLLQPSMPDLFEEAVEQGRQDYIETKRIVRAINPRKAETVVTDMAAEVSDLAAELERCMNGDTQETGFQLVPNTAWSAGLAAGYMLLWETDTVFIDLTSGPVSTRSVEWSLGSRAGGTRFTPLDTKVIAGPSESGPVLVRIDLTGPSTTPEWQVCKTYLVGVLEDDSTPRRVTVDVDVDTAQLSPSPHRTPGEPPRRFLPTVVHPMAAAQAGAAAIRRAIHENPGRDVLLCARVTKTISWGIGACLTRDKKHKDPGCGTRDCQNVDCYDPWRRLLPLIPDAQIKCGEYGIARVHPAQPPAEMLAQTYRCPSQP